MGGKASQPEPPKPAPNLQVRAPSLPRPPLPYKQIGRLKTGRLACFLVHSDLRRLARDLRSGFHAICQDAASNLEQKIEELGAKIQKADEEAPFPAACVFQGSCSSLHRKCRRGNGWQSKAAWTYSGSCRHQ